MSRQCMSWSCSRTRVQNHLLPLCRALVCECACSQVGLRTHSRAPCAPDPPAVGTSLWRELCVVAMVKWALGSWQAAAGNRLLRMADGLFPGIVWPMFNPNSRTVDGDAESKLAHCRLLNRNHCFAPPAKRRACRLRGPSVTIVSIHNAVRGQP